MSFLEAGFILREDIIKNAVEDEKHQGEVVREEIWFLPDRAWAPVCVQETGCGGEDDEI